MADRDRQVLVGTSEVAVLEFSWRRHLDGEGTTRGSSSHTQHGSRPCGLRQQLNDSCVEVFQGTEMAPAATRRLVERLARRCHGPRAGRATLPLAPPLRPGTGRPTVSRSTGHVMAFGSTGDRPSLLNHEPGQAQSRARSQSSINVRHELLVVERFLDCFTQGREVFPINKIQIMSSHDLDQRV